jgi:hypothetical protein
MLKEIHLKRRLYLVLTTRPSHRKDFILSKDIGSAGITEI